MKFDRRISRRSFLAAAGVSAAALALTACGGSSSTQLTTQSGLLTRKVPMTTGSGAMLDTNVYDFIDHSTSFLFLPRGVVIGLAMNNEWGFTGYLYAPPLSEAGSALRSYAAGRTQMGAVFIEYGGETYVVAMFA